MHGAVTTNVTDLLSRCVVCVHSMQALFDEQAQACVKAAQQCGDKALREALKRKPALERSALLGSLWRGDLPAALRVCSACGWSLAAYSISGWQLRLV